MALNALRAFSYFLAVLALAGFLVAVGIGGATTRRLARWMAWSGVAIGTVLAVGVAVAQTGMAAAVEVAAYRIVQEALTDVLRHAGAHRCDVSVQDSDGQLVVTVADDGAASFPAAGNGSGLETMRERAEELGGSLEHLPRPGGGTVVRAVLPRNPS